MSDEQKEAVVQAYARGYGDGCKDGEKLAAGGYGCLLPFLAYSRPRSPMQGGCLRQWLGCLVPVLVVACIIVLMASLA